MRDCRDESPETVKDERYLLDFIVGDYGDGGPSDLVDCFEADGVAPLEWA